MNICLIIILVTQRFAEGHFTDWIVIWGFSSRGGGGCYINIFSDPRITIVYIKI